MTEIDRRRNGEGVWIDGRNMSCTVPETYETTEPSGKPDRQRTDEQLLKPQQLATSTRGQLDSLNHWRNVWFTAGALFLLFGVYDQSFRGVIVGAALIGVAWIFQLSIPVEEHS